MGTIYKTFNIQRKTIDAEQGIYEAVISTEDVDRDGDIIRADGIELDNYLKNPVVLAAHSYRDLDAVIGKALEISIVPGQGIRARFQFAPEGINPTADLARKLWAAELLNATSIGFIPKQGKPGANGRGMEYTKWELLEFSVVSVPSQANAIAIRMLKGLDAGASQADQIGPVAKKDGDAPGRAWVRRATIESRSGTQTVLLSFYRHSQDVPEDATLLTFDPVDGACAESPHPEAGKTVWFKHVLFAPPLEISGLWGKDAIYGLAERDRPDDELVAGRRDREGNELWHVDELGEVLAQLEPQKAWQAPINAGYGVPIVTRRSAEIAKSFALRLAKRGRVLSAKNEATLKEAQVDAENAAKKVESVLKQLEPAPDDEGDESQGDDKHAQSPISAEGERDLADLLRQTLGLVAQSVLE